MVLIMNIERPIIV